MENSKPRVQNLDIYDLPSWKKAAIKEIQEVLRSRGEIKIWVGWLEEQTKEILWRLQQLNPDHYENISAFTDNVRCEPLGTAVRRWQNGPNKALDLALWRIERRWMPLGTPSRQTLTGAVGDLADKFVKEASKGGALKDVGAPLTHGEYPHRIQWYIIYRHLMNKGYTNDDIYQIYLELLNPKHIRHLNMNDPNKYISPIALSNNNPQDILHELMEMKEDTRKSHRSLWDRVVDIRLSERSSGVEDAYWAAPLTVTASFTNYNTDSQNVVAKAVTSRLVKRRGQKMKEERYFVKGEHKIDTAKLNDARENVNKHLAKILNLNSYKDYQRISQHGLRPMPWAR